MKMFNNLIPSRIILLKIVVYPEFDVLKKSAGVGT